MDLRDIVRGRHVTGADRPKRLVGHGCFASGLQVGQACRQLGAADGESLAGTSLRLRLADADDRREPGGPRGLHLGGDLRVRLVVEPAALGMAEDHGRGAGILEHVGVDIPGEGAGCLRAAVFAPDRQGPEAGAEGALDEGRRNADEHVGMRRLGFHRCRDGFDLLQLRRQPMHLPISGNERPHSLLH